MIEWMNEWFNTPEQTEIVAEWMNEWMNGLTLQHKQK